ncbi:hypothetical protein E2I00_010326 [Balaenoptera physalus]|uniref:thioredoxin-dependent peroxiredoxin n=1 Tax=Balaenoptera physalus TaxID=9770 RepID=A0A643BLI8_BALPH|nr:hypothetical protein E2I00_010326 [Balaenoptera physalus]
MGIGCTAVAAWWREKWRSSQRTCNCPRVVMEAPQRLLATTSAPSWSRKLLLLRLLLFLLPAKALWGLEVEERPPTHEEECHFYACTQVYLVGRRPRFRLPTTPCTSAKPRFPSQHLIDLNHQISKDYSVYLEDSGHTLRGLFITDDKGILKQITLNDLPGSRFVDETLRLVQAFLYTDKHGEVCPGGWKPGGETVIPDPARKLKYFDKLN